MVEWSEKQRARLELWLTRAFAKEILTLVSYSDIIVTTKKISAVVIATREVTSS